MKPNSGYPETGCQGQFATQWIRTDGFEPTPLWNWGTVRSPGQAGAWPVDASATRSERPARGTEGTQGRYSISAPPGNGTDPGAAISRASGMGGRYSAHGRSAGVAP